MIQHVFEILTAAPAEGRDTVRFENQPPLNASRADGDISHSAMTLKWISMSQIARRMVRTDESRELVHEQNSRLETRDNGVAAKHSSA